MDRRSKDPKAPRYVKWNCRFGEPPERLWTDEEIEAAYRSEHPDATDEQVLAMVNAVLEWQRESLKDWYNAQRRFHEHAVLVGRKADEPDDPSEFDQ